MVKKSSHYYEDWSNRMALSLPSMVYGEFQFPNNPAQCSYNSERAVARHKYPELNATELEDLGADAAIISGVGEFFGEDAYIYWEILLAEYKRGGVKSFYHPIFTDVSQVILKKLSAVLEPRSDYIKYEFEFWEHIPVVQHALPKPKPKPKSGGSSSKRLGTLRRGNRGKWVIALQKKLKSDLKPNPLPKYGVDGIYGSETESAVRKYQKKHKLRVDGIAGPETLGHMGIDYYTGASGPSNSKNKAKIHIVKSGENLSVIASKHHTTWQTLAKLNHLKNPHSIKPGQKIKLP